MVLSIKVMYSTHASRKIVKDFIYLVLERVEGREKERERNIDGVPLLHPSSGDQTVNPGMCPDQESIRQLLALRNDAQPTEPHQSGRK